MVRDENGNKTPVTRRARVLQRRHNLKYTEAFRIAEKEQEQTEYLDIHGPTPEWYFLPEDPERKD